MELAHLQGPDGNYPPSLRITLTRAELESLGISDLPPVGTEEHLEAVAHVVRVTAADHAGTDSATLELQITHLTLSSANPVAMRENRAAKVWESPIGKLAERNVGGSPHVGEFGVSNRRVGA